MNPNDGNGDDQGQTPPVDPGMGGGDQPQGGQPWQAPDAGQPADAPAGDAPAETPAEGDDANQGGGM